MQDGSASTPPLARRAPALLPAVALLAGMRLGLGLCPPTPEPPWGPLLGLALLGVALGGRAGALVTVGAAGMLTGVGAGPGGTPGARLPDPDRPVAAVVQVTGHWRRFDDAWSAPVRVERLRQPGRAGTGSGRAKPGGTGDVRTRPIEATLRLPGAAPPPPLGSRLRVRGHLRRAPPLGNLPVHPAGPWRLSVKSRRLLEEIGGPGPLGALASDLRRRVEAGLQRAGGRAGQRADERAGPAPASGLALPMVRALVLGDSSRVPPAVRRGLRRLGLAHVLAVSGLHVGLVAGLVLVLGVRLPRRPRLAAALATVAAYLLLVGPRPSLLRASLMAVLAAAALWSERPPQAANALAVAAAGIALADPRVVIDLGFRLTVGATAGIVLLGPVLARRWAPPDDALPGGSDRASQPAGRQSAAGLLTRESTRDLARSLTRVLIRSLAASAGAQIGVLPWALPAFCLLTPWAPVANLLAVPWTALALVGCLAWTALAVIRPALAAPALAVLEWVTAPFAWPAALAPRPWIALPVSVGVTGAALIAGGLALALWRPRSRSRLWWLLPVVLVAVAMTAAGPGTRHRGPVGGEGARAVGAVLFDVGQGDAILLRDGDDAMLVDGGGWRHGDLGGRVLLPALVRRGVRRLDAVVVTHPDRDHCGGLVDLAGYLAVGEAISGPGVGESPCGRELDALPGVVRRVVTAGDRLRVGRWRLRILHPAAGRDGAGRRATGGSNDASLVIIAEVFGRRLLLTGDVEAAGERRLLREAPE
ncbi:MAG: ComEC/Rec2 family competence protein, partial [Acidobacteriota bacterium]